MGCEKTLIFKPGEYEETLSVLAGAQEVLGNAAFSLQLRPEICEIGIVYPPGAIISLSGYYCSEMGKNYSTRTTTVEFIQGSTECIYVAMKVGYISIPIEGKLTAVSRDRKARGKKNEET